ncbi:MAG: hypothetical protein AB8B99_14135 [Phormidesmis sp.]
MKKVIVSLLALGALSTAAIPAQADTATVNEGVQTSITSGHRNRTSQESVQTTSNQNRNTRDNVGNSSFSDQYSDTYGTDNETIQRVHQRTDNNSTRTRSNRHAH